MRHDTNQTNASDSMGINEHCDTLCRRIDKNGLSTTLIGRLIQKSKRYSAADNQALFLLKLTTPSDEEFYDAIVDEDASTGQHMTIPQLASTLPEWDLAYAPRAPRAHNFRDTQEVLRARIPERRDRPRLRSRSSSASHRENRESRSVKRIRPRRPRLEHSGRIRLHAHGGGWSALGERTRLLAAHPESLTR
jgi:hypothetical protein